MTDSIRVCCRFRKDPPNEELDDWVFDKEKEMIKLREKKFNFDKVLDMDTLQEEMYEHVAKNIIKDFTNGFHGTMYFYI